MLAENGGEFNTATIDLTQTRHLPPPSVAGNYHHTAQSLGDMVNRNAYSALQGALLATRG